MGEHGLDGFFAVREVEGLAFLRRDGLGGGVHDAFRGLADQGANGGRGVVGRRKPPLPGT